MRRCLLILGNGGAALSAVRGARSSGYDGQICLVSDTCGPAFNPMLAPYYLKDVIPWERCFPFGIGFYRDYDVTCRFGSAVESLDATNQHITLDDGQVLTYDRCLIATGASPVVPPVPGLQVSPRTCVLRTAGSTRVLEKSIASARKAIVLGASFVGLKVAEILIKRQMDVVVMDVADQVLPRGAHPLVADTVRAWYEGHGIQLRLGCTIEGMEGSGRGVCCYLSDRITEEADLVVVCTGVRPNTAFLDPDQVRLEEGLVVDGRTLTTAPNIYGAGDACRTVNPASGGLEWMGTWRNACSQGWIAGCNMAGKDVGYSGAVSENITPFFEWTYAQIGDVWSAVGSDAESVVFGDRKKNELGLLLFVDGVLVAANLVNCTRLAGPIRNAIVAKSFWKDRDDVWKQDFPSPAVEALLRSAGCFG